MIMAGYLGGGKKTRKFPANYVPTVQKHEDCSMQTFPQNVDFQAQVRDELNLYV